MTKNTFLRTGYNGASVPNGTAATGGDGTTPGGNTGFLQVSALSGSTAVWIDDTRFGGAKSVRFTNAAGQSSVGRAPLPSSTYTPGIEFDLELPAVPDSASTPETLLTLRNGSGTIQVRLTSGLLLDLLTGVAGSQTSAAVPKKTDGTTAMSALVAGGLYRIGVWATGSSASVGNATVTMGVWAYGADKATFLGKTSAVAAVGTNPFTAGDVGILQYASSKSPAVSNVQVTDTATDFMGPFVSTNQPPTVTLPAPKSVTAGSVVSTTATAADSDGTIASYAWTLIAPSTDGATLTNPTSATVTFTAGSAGSVYVLQCTVTDNGGAQTSAVTEVRVEATGDVYPLANTPATGFVRTGGTSDGAALADSDDATYLETPNAVSATVQRCRVRVQPAATRSGFSVPVRLRKNGTGTCTATVTLQQGTTDKGSLGSIVLTDSWADYSLVLTTNQVNSITDWGSLFVVIDFTS